MDRMRVYKRGFRFVGTAHKTPYTRVKIILHTYRVYILLSHKGLRGGDAQRQRAPRSSVLRTHTGYRSAATSQHGHGSRSRTFHARTHYGLYPMSHSLLLLLTTLALTLAFTSLGHLGPPHDLQHVWQRWRDNLHDDDVVCT